MASIDHESPSTAALAGRVLAERYQLDHVLASGGMAEVWLADDTVLNRRVAVKVLHSHLSADPVFLARFRSEAKLAARLSHAGIVSIFDTVSEGGVEAIVMELLEGVDLRTFIDENGPLTPELARDLGAQVAAALHVAHEAELVHRDIKPANIMLVDDRRMKVTDFGIAKPSQGQDLTEHGTLIGTAKYLAPEQVEGAPVDGRTDVYALGIVLFECLTGKVPFTGANDISVAMARLQNDPPHVRSIRSTVPPSLDAVVHRAMSRDADDRFATAAELRAALLVADDATVITEASPTGEDDEIVAIGATEVIVSERRWLVPTAFIIIVATALAIAGALIGTTDVGRGAVTRAREVVGFSQDSTSEVSDNGSEETEPEAPFEGPVEPAAVIDVSTFDPQGSGTPGENDARVGAVYDGDPATTWATEGYDTRFFGGLKTGVGIIVGIDEILSVQAIQIDSPSSGWSAEIYLANEVPTTLAEWGTPVATINAFSEGSERVDSGDTEGQVVLVWFTDLGDGPPRVKVEISEIEIFIN